MKNSTVENFIKELKEIEKSELNLSEWCKLNDKNIHNYYNRMHNIKKSSNINEDLLKEASKLYDKLTNAQLKLSIVKESIDTDDRAEVSMDRDENGKIVSYSYKIYKRNKPSLTGSLTRDEMNIVHRLYSYYGTSLTQREISRQFPELSLIDFKRILRAFNITKASAPFAPHMFEEYTEEQLREIQLREKENDFLKKAESDQVKNNEKLLRKYAQENIELKKTIKNISKFQVTIPTNLVPIKINKSNSSANNDLILHISDLHIGASLTSGMLYQENINYGIDEVRRRLNSILNKISEFPNLNNIIINLMGDSVDCCGIDGKTARLDHMMPENMDSREQGNTYIKLMIEFINNIINNNMCNNIKVYSVPNGNHGGNFEYFCNKALLALINIQYPDIETKLFENFFGSYTFKNHTWVLCHGKDAQYMKKGLPLNVDEKSKTMLYEWFDDNKIYGDNIHVIKGDLHSNNINSCKKFDYRNVLSLFGASDYSNYNFSRNSYGMSYELFIGNNLIRGTFENI